MKQKINRYKNLWHIFKNMSHMMNMQGIIVGSSNIINDILTEEKYKGVKVMSIKDLMQSLEDYSDTFKADIFTEEENEPFLDNFNKVFGEAIGLDGIYDK